METLTRPAFIFAMAYKGRIIGIQKDSQGFRHLIFDEDMPPKTDAFSSAGEALNGAIAAVEYDLEWTAGFKAAEAGQPLSSYASANYRDGWLSGWESTNGKPYNL